MKKASEQTMIKVLVNYKCLGYSAGAMRNFTPTQRKYVYDELIRRGYMDENLNVLPASQAIVTANIHLCSK